MTKYRKKPVVIEATQIKASDFDNDHPNPDHICGVIYDPTARVVLIPTLEGEMRGNIGDWIITGVKGEKYPCKPDIFAATYEPADSTLPAPGAVAMREAAAKVAEKGAVLGSKLMEDPAMVDAWMSGVVDTQVQTAAAIRALPAPEVPEVVRTWCAIIDKANIGSDCEFEMRAWIKKEFQV